MGSEIAEFMIGDFECAVVSDGGASILPNAAKFLFANAPEPELNDALREHNIQGFDIPYRVNCLFINTGLHRILVDSGFGVGVHPAFGKLAKNLELLKVSPEDIDMLILTHAHGDHIGGVVAPDGKLNFLNARHIMAKVEWVFWMSEAGKLHESNAQVVNKHLVPIKDKIELLEPNAEIVPGVQLVPLPGHTPGHTGVSVTSGGDTLLHLVDTVLDPIHMEHPTWVAPVDMSAEQTVATRREFLPKAAKDKPLVLAYHFPFPGLGYVEAQGDSWAWRSI